MKTKSNMTVKDKKVSVSFEVDKETGVMRMKVDAPNKKMEKEVANNFLELIKTCGEITGEKVKVLKKGYTK